MESISAALIKSLKDLGLSNYEARVYAALVLYDNAEAKEIIDFLSISKPSVYEALDRLAEMGLAVKRFSKPARYSAISPEMAIDILIDKHRKAADQALAALRTLEKEKVRTDKEDALWTIYGDANIEYKIRDLFGKAKKHIDCMIGDRYLPFIENIKIQGIRLRLIVISETPGLAEKLHGLFPGENAEIHVISPERFHTPPPFAPPEFLEAKKFMNFGNVLEINVDDEELVMIPPFIGGSSSVLNTRNKGAIMHMKMFNQMRIRGLFEGEEFCAPLPPAHKKKR
jgi:sugar-specific transcriptional regulator TrmB